jgi:hypothetical protein
LKKKDRIPGNMEEGPVGESRHHRLSMVMHKPPETAAESHGGAKAQLLLNVLAVCPIFPLFFNPGFLDNS